MTKKQPQCLHPSPCSQVWGRDCNTAVNRRIPAVPTKLERLESEQQRLADKIRQLREQEQSNE